jgi:sporulation-control protein spo0M
MGFFDRMKGAMNFVTGGGAKVSVEWSPQVAMPGEAVQVRVVVTSTGGPISSGGVFIDVQANEELQLPENTVHGGNPAIKHTKQTYSETYQIAPNFSLVANQSHTFEGSFTMPINAQPTYDGPFADHDWGMRARVEMTGNDPDSGFKKFVVGKRQ